MKEKMQVVIPKGYWQKLNVAPRRRHPLPARVSGEYEELGGGVYWCCRYLAISRNAEPE